MMFATGKPVFISVVDAWERFWFEQIPPDSYALLRIVFGFLGLIAIASLTPVSVFWSLDGLSPLPGQTFGVKTFLLTHGMGPLAGWLYFSGMLCAFGAMLVGYKTEWAVRACFVGSALQTFWNRLPLSAAHQVLVVVLFCLLWAECDGTLSLDSWLDGTSRRPQKRVSIWPLRLIRIQVALIYLNSGLWKLFGVSWRDGSAIYYATSLNIFHRFPGGIPSIEWPIVFGTYLTLLWEIGFAIMLFNKVTRRLALAVGILVHIGIWAALEVGLFSWFMLATYIAFVDPKAVSDFVARSLRFVKSRQQSRCADIVGVSAELGRPTL